MAVYVGLVVYGIIPTIHWIYLSGGLNSTIVQVRIKPISARELFARKLEGLESQEKQPEFWKGEV